MNSLQKTARSEPSIRRLTHHDVQAYAALLLSLNQQDRMERFTMPVSDREAQGYSMRLFLSNCTVLGAFVEQELVGAVDVGADECEVADLGIVVAKESRNQRIGTKLMAAAIEYCKETGVTDAYFDCFMTNTAMVKLAEAAGFNELCRDRPSTYYRSIDECEPEAKPNWGGAVVIDFQSRRKLSA